MKPLFLFLFLPILSFSQPSTQDINRYEAQAKRVTIIRDSWGIPHIYGKTDADAVFGLMYSECEENFERVERNYLEVFGKLAEVDGADKLYGDLQMRLIYDSTAAMADYAKSPAWFKKLLDAFADGVNYYLYKHPETKPAVLTHFEAWYPLMYTDGSISATQMGGIKEQDTKELYALKNAPATSMRNAAVDEDPFPLTGSNGFAIAPSKTASKNAILYINPHVTFYFRTEVQMVSEEGLNAYGAVTWGNFFVYQGFNAHCGWMHTSSYADVADLYKEKITSKGDSIYYEYDNNLRPVKSKKLVLYYKKDSTRLPISVTAYYTHHGPVMGSRNGNWLSLKERNRSLEALEQSWLRTKANSFAEFKKAMDLRSDNSNNTVYADDQGNIAYWHGNFMPVRDTSLDWSMPVDGSTAATEWKGIHKLDETVHIYNPASGWIENCNSTPFTASGSSSPVRKDYPAYMAPDGQNPRAINAIRLLSSQTDFTLNKIIAVGYDHYLSAFDILLPTLFKAYEGIPATDSMKAYLKEPISLLQSWDKRSSKSSIPATIAIEWASALAQSIPRPQTAEEASHAIERLHMMAEKTSSAQKLMALVLVLKDLQDKFGSWKTPWGEDNRYQRNGDIHDQFNDSKPSLPVGMASSAWGSLPAFDGRRFPNTKSRYGIGGNSFIAAVEFGKKVKAKTIVTGGQSSDPSSKHFLDQAQMFIDGKFKDVWFYKADVLQHVERTYHPGE